MEDNQILDLYFNRSEQAIVETSAKYEGRLYRLGMKVLNNKEDTSECINDTYQAAWTTIPPKRPEYFFAYLAKITRNFAFGILDYKKAKKRDVLLVTLSDELEMCIPAPDEMERRMDSQEIGAAVSAFLHNQSDEMRKVFVRRYWYMDTINQIASEYHMTQSKVKSILFRMRGGLRDYLDKEGIIL